MRGIRIGSLDRLSKEVKRVLNMYDNSGSMTILHRGCADMRRV